MGLCVNLLDAHLRTCEWAIFVCRAAPTEKCFLQGQCGSLPALKAGRCSPPARIAFPTAVWTLGSHGSAGCALVPVGSQGSPRCLFLSLVASLSPFVSPQVFAALGALPPGSCVEVATPALLRGLSGREATPIELHAWEASFAAGGASPSVAGSAPHAAHAAKADIGNIQTKYGSSGLRLDSFLFSKASSSDESDGSSQHSVTSKNGNSQETNSATQSLASNEEGSVGTRSTDSWTVGTQAPCSVCLQPVVLVPLWLCPACFAECHVRCLARSTAAAGQSTSTILAQLVPQQARCPAVQCGISLPWAQVASSIRGRVQSRE